MKDFDDCFINTSKNMTGTSNVDDYVMGMLSIADENSSSRKFNSVKKHQCPVNIDDEPKKSSPIVEKTEKEISPGVMQYTVKIVEEHRCTGMRAERHVSCILNKKKGTIITVEKTDMTPEPNKRD